MTRVQSVAACALLGVALHVTQSTGAASVGDPIRGLSPLQQQALHAQGGVHCSVSGELRLLPLDRVNDEYCDCDDGQDEPGTSACSHLTTSVFYCHNGGFFPKNISTSLLNDGVCDCCDGSDEADANAQTPLCPNTCIVEVAKHREEAERWLTQVESGYLQREKALYDVVEMRTSDAKLRLKRIEAELMSLQSLKKRVEVHKAREERREKQLRLEDARQHQGEQEDEEANEEDSESPSTMDGSNGGDAGVGECAGEVCDTANEPEAPAAAPDTSSIDAMSDEPPASESTEDSSTDDTATVSETPQEETPSEGDTAGADVHAKHVRTLIELSDGTKVSLDDYLQMDHTSPVPPHDQKPKDPHVDKMQRGIIDRLLHGDEEEKKRVGLRVLRTIGLICSPVRLVVDAVLFAPRTLWAVVDSSVLLQPYVERLPSLPSPTQSTAFRGLAGGKVYRAYKLAAWMGQVIWDAPIWAYRYMFPEIDHDLTLPEAESLRRVFQEVDNRIRELQQEDESLHVDQEFDFGPERAYLAIKGECVEKTVEKYVYKFCPFDQVKQDYTSLGKWDDWAPQNDTHKDYNSMRYTQGQRCWNGPERSITVQLECGDVNDIVAVHEPSTCVYEMTVRTYLACTLDVLTRARNDVAFWSQ